MSTEALKDDFLPTLSEQAEIDAELGQIEKIAEAAIKEENPPFVYTEKDRLESLIASAEESWADDRDSVAISDLIEAVKILAKAMK